jgi:hypothetical protein
VPAGILHPPGVWVYDWVIPVIGSAIIVWAAARCWRARRLTWGFLFLVSSMLTFWLETMGDWGQHLVYSPAFAHYSWDWMPWHTQSEPYFMPFAYAAYWTVHAWVVLRIAQWLATRQGWTLLKAVLVLSIPINFAWPNFIAYVAGKPTSSGLNVIERWFRLDRFTRPLPAPAPTGGQPTAAFSPGAGGTTTLARPRAAAVGVDYEVVGTTRVAFEARRLGAWLLTFQVTFLLMLVMPLVLLRIITGHNSPYVP